MVASRVTSTTSGHVDSPGMDELDEEPALGALIDAVERLAQSLPGFDELDHLGRFTESIEEISAAPNEWELLVALLRAWPPELFAVLVERAASDASTARALEAIDDESAVQALSSLGATPSELVARLRVAPGSTS